nr:MAG TPA: Late transcription unit A [Caudoviricetes sp.]
MGSIGRPDRRAALTDGLSPIGFLDVHGLIERVGGGLTPL